MYCSIQLGLLLHMLLLVRHVLSLMHILLHFVSNVDAMVNVVVACDVAVHVAYVVAVHVAYAVKDHQACLQCSESGRPLHISVILCIFLIAHCSHPISL